MIKKIYGIMKLKKGSILYHTSENKYKKNDKKPMIFCIFHPSEWVGKYVNYIKLKKSILLLFMIETIVKDKIFSSLNIMTKHPYLNLAKKNIKNLKCYVSELKNNNLDGWFTSIENKTSVEVALINSNKLYKVIKTEKMTRNWRNGNNLNNIKTYKNWGNKYKICTMDKPVKLKINLKYKKEIKNYKKYEKKSGYPQEYILQVILHNAKIYYHKKEKKDIIWKC
jgi:hypothetical protein